MKASKVSLKDVVVSIIVISFTVLLILRIGNLFYCVKVPSSSMSPTIVENSMLVAEHVNNNTSYKRGDIIIFYKENNKNFLITKRVIGLPGDKITIDEGIVSVNGEILKESYVLNNDEWTGEFEVPNNKFLCLGDNRSNSLDARYWTDPYVDKNNVTGKIIFSIYPSFKFID